MCLAHASCVCMQSMGSVEEKHGVLCKMYDFMCVVCVCECQSKLFVCEYVRMCIKICIYQFVLVQKIYMFVCMHVIVYVMAA